MAELIVADRVDLSATGNTKCKGCYKKIKKGLPRVRRSFQSIRYGIVNGYLCHKCYEEGLTSEIQQLEEQLQLTKGFKEKMKELIELKQKEILAEEIVDSLTKSDEDMRFSK